MGDFVDEPELELRSIPPVALALDAFLPGHHRTVYRAVSWRFTPDDQTTLPGADHTPLAVSDPGLDDRNRSHSTADPPAARSSLADTRTDAGSTPVAGRPAAVAGGMGRADDRA